jgi:hypothetical protein
VWVAVVMHYVRRTAEAEAIAIAAAQRVFNLKDIRNIILLHRLALSIDHGWTTIVCRLWIQIDEREKKEEKIESEGGKDRRRDTLILETPLFILKSAIVCAK